MKHLFLWGSLIILAILVGIIWKRASLVPLFAEGTCPLYVDIVMLLTCLWISVSRLHSLIEKILH